jgi:hypothetical protein
MTKEQKRAVTGVLYITLSLDLAYILILYGFSIKETWMWLLGLSLGVAVHLATAVMTLRGWPPLSTETDSDVSASISQEAMLTSPLRKGEQEKKR